MNFQMEIARASKVNIVRPISKHDTLTKEKPLKEHTASEDQKKDRYEPSVKEEKQQGAYSNMTEKEREKVIAELKKETEKLYDSMKKLVEKLLKQQGLTFQDFLDGEVNLKEIEIDEDIKAKAATLIADDGPLGAEAVSDRIVKFAIALSGDDPSRLETIKKAIDDGFEAVKNIIGELPDISVRTYDLIMEKLNRWEEEKTSQ